MGRKSDSLDHMTPEEERGFLAAFEADLTHDDGAAAKEHLAAGRAIYYCDDDTPVGLVIKRYPDGRRELVRFVAGKEHTVSNLDVA